MFHTDTLLKNAHDLSLAAKMVRDAYAYEMPKAQAAHSGASRRLVLALAAAAPMVFWVVWQLIAG